MKQIMMFVLPIKISIKLDKVVNNIVGQINEILSKYADRNAELVTILPPGVLGRGARFAAVIQYDA